MNCSGPRGVLEVYLTGGSDGASYCKPKKIHKPEILDPKKYLASKFPTPRIQDLVLTVFPEHTSLKKSHNKNPIRKVRSEIKPKKYAYFFKT